MARHTLRSASVRLTFASAETHAGHGRLGFFGKNAPRQKVAAAAAGAWQVSRLSVYPFHINFSKTQKKREASEANCCCCHVRQRFAPPHFGTAKRGEARGKRSGRRCGGGPKTAPSRVFGVRHDHPIDHPGALRGGPTWPARGASPQLTAASPAIRPVSLVPAIDHKP